MTIHAGRLSVTVPRIQSMQDAANEAIRSSHPAPPTAVAGGGGATLPPAVIPAPWDGALLPAETPVEEITPSPIEATPAAVVGLDLDALVTDDTLPSQQEGTPSDRARAVVTGDREAGTRRRLWRSQAAPPSSVVDTGEDSL